MTCAIVSEPELIAAKFHNTLAEIIVEIAERVGEPRVVLTGGCFQNRYLTRTTVRTADSCGFSAYWHQRVPPNDGGIALGRLLAARCQLRMRFTGGRNSCVLQSQAK